MRKLVLVALLTVSTLVLLYLITVFVSEVLNDEAEIALEKYSVLVSDYKSNHGRLPDTLDQLDISREKLFLVIEPIGIHFSKRSEPILFFEQFPLGPRRVLYLNSRALVYEE